MTPLSAFEYFLQGIKMNPWLRRLTCLRSLLVVLLAISLRWPVMVVGQTVIVDPPIVVPMNTLSISDIDFVNSTSPKLLFTISMRTSDGSTVDATMTISLNFSLSSGETFTDAMIIQTTPAGFTIPGTRTITNLDLGKSIPILKAEINQAARQRLEDIALSSGIVPSGTYDFRVEVTPKNGTTPQRQGFTIVLSNPSSIEPVFPQDGDQLATPFPFFQWRYEGNARLSVFEKLESQGSLEEAASGVALLTAESSTQSYQYPSVGVRSLRPGKTYVWYLEGLAPTSGGTNLIQRSALRWFTVAPEGGTGGVGLGTASILDQLERALGPKYKPLFDQIRAQGLSPESTFRLNGRVLTSAELNEILERFLASPDMVLSVERQ